MAQTSGLFVLGLLDEETEFVFVGFGVSPNAPRIALPPRLRPGDVVRGWLVC